VDAREQMICKRLGCRFKASIQIAAVRLNDSNLAAGKIAERQSEFDSNPWIVPARAAG
jgi:hypothetical protein